MSVDPGKPEAGFYKVKLVKDGPWVSVAITHTASQPDRSPMWVVIRGGEYVDIWDVWPGCSGNRITSDEYDYLCAVYEWARVSGGPESTPRQAINHLKSQPIF